MGFSLDANGGDSNSEESEEFFHIWSGLLLANVLLLWDERLSYKKI